LLVVIATVIAVVWWHGRGANDIDPAVLLEYRPAQVTRILARDGTLIGELHGGERRTVVSYDELPQTLIDAFLAAEDADFFEHGGLDWPSIARATAANLRRLAVREGASTITQQVIKNTLLSRERTVERKSVEIVLARRVEAVLDKRQILEIYVNEIYFGEGRYGVVEAARYYFGKSLAELDLGEAATLAALPHAPGVVTCYRRVEELRARRDYVLRQMVEHDLAEADEVAPFLGRPIQARDRDQPDRAVALGEADEFVELARLELIHRYGEDALLTLGATVRTSVDLEIQRRARAAGREQLDRLEARHGYGTHSRPLATRARVRLEAGAPEQLEVGRRVMVIIADHGPLLIDGRLRASLAAHEVEIELGPELAQLDELRLAARFAPGTAVAVRVSEPATATSAARAQFEAGPEFALVLADHRSGELLAVLGGREFERGQFDRARHARRQVASTFKPIVHGAALRTGRYTPASQLPGHDLDLRGALAQSDNAVPLALVHELGPAPVHAFARDLGIESPLTDHDGLALGISELTPLELMTAYMTIARGGAGVEPTAILAIEVPADLRGDTPEPIAASAAGRRFGIEAEVAEQLVSMLRSAVEDGTGKLARSLGRPVAGKTGTTDEARDLWFVGFTTEHVGLAWVGFDQPASLGRNESGSSLALAIWLAALASSP
jgi:penicillin-binding protein 1A